MENNYSNYDMLDKLIGNNKKAKSWTAFWMIMLCLMAAAVLWLAYTVSEKNKTITLQGQIIQTSELNLELKSRIIDSLTENCNDAKSALVKSCDSVVTQTQNTLLSITNNATTAGAPVQISAAQQAEIRAATKSLQIVKTNLYNVKVDIAKNNTKLFVQYNNNQNTVQVNRFLNILKRNSEYVVAPAEYIDRSFSTVIKFYNYTNSDEEKQLTTLLARQFNIAADKIVVTHERSSKVKNIVEVWIGTRPAATRAVQRNNK